MLKMEYYGFEVQYHACDALDSKVAGASAGMTLAVWGRQHVLLFQS